MRRWSHGSEAKAPDPDAHHHQKWRQVVDEAVQLRGIYFLVLIRATRHDKFGDTRSSVPVTASQPASQPALSVFDFLIYALIRGFPLLHPALLKQPKPKRQPISPFL